MAQQKSPPLKVQPYHDHIRQVVENLMLGGHLRYEEIPDDYRPVNVAGRCGWISARDREPLSAEKLIRHLRQVYPSTRGRDLPLAGDCLRYACEAMDRRAKRSSEHASSPSPSGFTYVRAQLTALTIGSDPILGLRECAVYADDFFDAQQLPSAMGQVAWCRYVGYDVRLTTNRDLSINYVRQLAGILRTYNVPVNSNKLYRLSAPASAVQELVTDVWKTLRVIVGDYYDAQGRRRALRIGDVEIVEHER